MKALKLTPWMLPLLLMSVGAGAAPPPAPAPGSIIELPAAVGRITAIHDGAKIAVQDILFNVDDRTRITGAYQQPLALGSLSTGMRVRVFMRRGVAGPRFYADRIEKIR